MIVLRRAAVGRPVLMLLAGFITLCRRVYRAGDQPACGDDQGRNQNRYANRECFHSALLFHGSTRREDSTPTMQGETQIKRGAVAFTFLFPNAACSQARNVVLSCSSSRAILLSLRFIGCNSMRPRRNRRAHRGLAEAGSWRSPITRMRVSWTCSSSR